MPRIPYALNMLRDDPRRFLRHFRCRATPCAFLPKHPARRAIDGVTFEFDLALDPAVKKMYFDCYEDATVDCIRRILRPGDVFVDVGANIGYITARGAGRVGPSGEVHSFEPVPAYRARLQRLVELNPAHRIRVNECALSDSAGTVEIRVSQRRNIGFNTMVPGFMAESTPRETVTVPTRRLDDYIREARIAERVALIKIDVEGAESLVLKGLTGFFEDGPRRPPILCEIAPAAYRHLPTSLEDLETFLGAHGYRPCDLTPDANPVSLSSLTATTDVLFRAGP